TRIYSGISQALDILEKESEEERQKFIILLSDGEDSYSSQSISQAKRAGEQGIRIFALMIGSGTLQMQNIAIHSNGIYKNSPTATEISEIMHFFASEVFDTAGRNTTFKTVIKDKNTIDIDSLIPKPSKVTDNGDGSLNLEWYFERISIHEAEQIKIPFKLTGMLDAGFAELTQETSCVYYDRMGKPTVIYMEDVSAPISRYVEEGKWSVVYDSQEEETPWYSIYWDSNLPGDSRIEVYASVSEDGINFGEAKLIRNYQEIRELVGRYIKLDVHMFISSDGRTPELYDITICGKEEVELTHTNLPPIINIITNGRTKVNYPLNVRAEISDDGLPSEMTILWSSNSSNITIANNESLATTVVAQKAGVYQLLCTVSDGEHTRSDTIDIVVEEEDHYDDIDPEGGVEAPAPEIEVNIPKYANPRQKIDAQIINLNQTEISWYSVIINGSQVINVADDGSFSFTTPNSNARQSVVVRAFDWSGKSDMKEYVINIDATVPEIKVTVSAETVMVGDDSPTFTVSISNEHKIQSIQYMLNGQEVSLDENNQYHLDTTYSGTYEFVVKTVTITGEVLTEKALIEVQEAEPDTEGPVITVALIDTVELGESIDLMVMAEDEGGIDRIEVTLNGNLIDLIDGKYEFTPTKEGEYTFNIKAFDMAGNMSELTRVVTVIDTVVILPEFTLNFDKEKYEENDNLTATVVVSGAAIIVDLSVKYDHEEIKLDENNGFTIENLTAGLHTIQVVAKDQSGHQLTKEYSFVVEKKQDSTEPELNVTIDMPEDFKLGDTLVIKVEASDNNGIPTVVVRVNGIELMGQDGTYEFTPLSSGEYNIEVTAMDEAGNISKVSHLIMIDDEEEEPDTTPPELKVTIPENRVISIGETLTFKVEVTDEGGEVIVETQSPGGPVTIQGDTYTYTAHQAGIHTVVITATDQAGNQANYYFEIIVVDDEARDWVVKLIVNNDIPEAEINTEISIKVAVIAENLKDSLVLMVNDEELNLNEHGEATFIPSKKGLYHIIAKVIDEKGKEILEEVELFVYDPEDTNSPDVMIKSPLDGAVVLAPTEIRGSVQGEALIYYTVEYCKSGETEYTEIARGTEVVDDGVLALFDPTLLENGWYQIRLTAYGSNSHKIDEISVSVEGEMKVGNFTTAFRDMDIPVVGFPLTVIRGYDSRKKNVKGDFGYGWDLSTASITLSEACIPGEAWIQTKTSGPLGLTYFSLVEDKPHTVVVDFGNGKIDKFDMKLTPDSQQLTPIQYDISVSYIAKPGTTSKLEALGKTTGLIHNNENLYYSSDFTIYHPEKYKLTTEDGTIYILNDKTGVESITDVNGNVIVFDENGVTHSDGKSIVFE
ncbi:MAG: VWA domain-containing protein, partial [Clostridiales bacterium]|nr:VWA domain-containing protein [Clostridiales bacterium]